MNEPPIEVKRMRKAAMKVGVFACYMPKGRFWVLLKVSASTAEVGINTKGFTYPQQFICHAQFAMVHRDIRGLPRNRKTAQRPYPKTNVYMQQQFKSERNALMTFLLKGEELKWSK